MSFPLDNFERLFNIVGQYGDETTCDYQTTNFLRDNVSSFSYRKHGVLAPVTNWSLSFDVYAI